MPTTKGGSGARPAAKKAPARPAPRARDEKRPARQVLFVQGGGRGTHDSWDHKLAASLGRALGTGYAVRYPRMPDEANPDPTHWKKTIARELTRLGGRPILVGHSVGAAIVLDYLCDAGRGLRIAGVFLVAAPFIGEGGWPSEDLRPTSEVARALARLTPLHFYQGGADDTVPPSHVEKMAKAFPAAAIHRLAGRDHQLNDDLSEVARDIARLR